jgi:hypothetical protein
MSIILEQSTEQLSKSASVNSRIELQSIKLSRCQIIGIPKGECPKLPIKLTVTFSSSYAGTQAGVLSVGLDFRLDAKDSSETEKGVLDLSCTFEANYELLQSYEPAQDEIEAFAGGNAVFNCWPYFREIVQNLTLRMGLAIPPVPFLRVQTKPQPTPTT